MLMRTHPPAEWAVAVADAFEAIVDRNPDIRLILPTGATPAPVYAELTRRGVSLAGATVFLLDEFGGLAPGHPQRCHSMIAPFLEATKVERSRYVRLDPDGADLKAACRRVQDALDSQPVDLTMLGLGMNGHLGLNEPGSEADSTTRRVDLTPETVDGAARYGGTGAPSFGLTIGLSTVLASRRVWLLVTGSHKRPILSTTLHGPISAGVPASLLRRHANTTVWCDSDASSPS